MARVAVFGRGSPLVWLASFAMMQVRIPRRMQHLPKDARGYPIPVTVFRDKDGRAHFTINDEAKRSELMLTSGCGICGAALLPIRWFVGGPLSAFHPQGAYFDIPMHRDCMHYALKVCPYLAMPSYVKRIDTKTLQHPEPNRIFQDPTMIPERPAVFVAVASSGHAIRQVGMTLYHLIPYKPYSAVEYWKDGKQISNTQGELLAAEAMRARG